MRIALLGWWGFGNMGDDLILSNLVSWVAPHRAVILTDRPAEIAALGIDADIEPLTGFEDNTGGYDLILFGGGGLLNERYVRKVVPEETIGQVRAPIVTVSVGVPFAEWLGGCAYFLDHCEHVTVRDPIAARMITDAGLLRSVDILPDPGFLTPHAGSTPDDVVGLNIRDVPPAWRGPLPDDVTERLGAGLLGAIETCDARGVRTEVIAVEPRDAEMYERLGVKHRLVTYRDAPAVLGELRALVTMRLHGGIVAVTQGTPVRVVDYQSKMRGLDEVLGSGLLVDAARADLASAAIAAMEEPRDRHAERLASMRETLAAFRARFFG